MIHGIGNKDFERLESNHQLRYYEMEGVFHRGFFHNQETVRYNMVIKGGGRSQTKRIPAFFRIHKVIKWQDPKSMKV